MKLKQDCVRYVLLSLEKQQLQMLYQGFTDSQIANVIANETFDKNDIVYTLYQLNSGGFISAKPFINKMVRQLTVYDITWSGHELLDSIRDDEVWKQTKKATNTLKSVSIGVLKSVATTVLTGIIKKNTGLPL